MSDCSAIARSAAWDWVCAALLAAPPEIAELMSPVAAVPAISAATISCQPFAVHRFNRCKSHRGEQARAVAVDLHALEPAFDAAAAQLGLGCPQEPPVDREVRAPDPLDDVEKIRDCCNDVVVQISADQRC